MWVVSWPMPSLTFARCGAQHFPQSWAVRWFPTVLSCAVVSHRALCVLGIASVHLYSVCCPLKWGPAVAGSIWSLDCNLLTFAVNASKSHLCFFSLNCVSLISVRLCFNLYLMASYRLMDFFLYIFFSLSKSYYMEPIPLFITFFF